MTIGDRIKEQRLKNNLSQEELGRLVGVQKAAINKYETNIVVNLKQSMIEKLAKALGVSPIYLLGYEDEKELAVDWYTPLTDSYLAAKKETRQAACDVLDIDYVDPGEETPDMYYMPKFSEGAVAGIPAYYDMNGEYEEVGYPSEKVPHGTDAAIQINGASMEPTISDGATVFIKFQPLLNNNDIGVFMVKGDAVCKRFFRTADGISLMSDNPKFETIKIEDDDFGVVGKVLGWTEDE